MFDWGSVVGAGINLIGGLGGGAMAQSAQLGISREYMDWMERMSSTAHQREVEDLRKAGLNPILSAKLGGSSSPTGNAPTMQNWVGDAVKSSVNTALAYKVADAQIEQLEAQNRLLDAQSDGVKLDNWNKQFDIDNSMPEMRRSNALFQIDKLQNEINELKSRSNQQGASAASIWKDIEVKNKQIESLAAGIGETVERTQNIIADTKAKMLQLPSAAAEGRRGRLESEYLDSEAGKALFLWNLGRKDSGLSPFDAFKRR